MNGALERIAAQRVVPVLRGEDLDDVVRTARACACAGMTVTELTCTTPDVERGLRELNDEGLFVGLGTVTDAGRVTAAAAAGAKFVVSFGRPPGFVAAALEQGLVPIPGALTPTEVLEAIAEDAPAVKLFPARVLQPAYLRDLRAVMPELRTMVTGGVTAETAQLWLEAGAIAVGIGGELGSAATDGDAVVERRARALLALATTG